MTVDLKVDNAGNVDCVTYLKGHPLLAQAAIDAARRWKFQPLKLSGVAVGFYGSLRIDFPKASSVDDLCSVVGQPVTLSGKFSLFGKIGAFITVGGRSVYLVQMGSFSWGSYEKMEGKMVTMTGTLHFYKSPPVPPGPIAVARLPDHYYMETESAKVELVN